MKIYDFIVNENGNFPNNPSIPLLLYKEAVDIAGLFPARKIKALLKANGWYNAWDNGIYDYHHYHSITHEVLVAYRGVAIVELGGGDGLKITFAKGDVLIIPAGVAHKKIGERDKFACVGAYPDGMAYDMNLGTKAEKSKAQANIVFVPIPLMDPIAGNQGPLTKYWKT